MSGGERPRVYIAYTGGTVGMKKDAELGYLPAPGFLARWLAAQPVFRSPELPEWKVHEYEPLLDSANTTPREWLRIAEDIRDHYDDYDGFLVIHGTDTMAYTASALSFMLEGLGKPVLLTGSQIPLCETRNDAAENLLTALMLIGRYHSRIAEVCIYFHQKLLRGNRTTKVSTEGFDAFLSPNCAPLGEIGVEFELDFSRLRAPADKPTRPIVREIGQAVVGSFRLFPGLRAETVRAVLQPPLQGLVLECFGAGNAPHRNLEFLEALAAATARGVVVVAVPQALYGSADLDLYATGRALRQVGVVSGYDMTPEAALAKLFYLFEVGHGPQGVEALMQQDLRGELTLPRESAHR